MNPLSKNYCSCFFNSANSAGGILIKPISGREGRLRNITGPDLDLMVARAKVYLGEYFGSYLLIKQDINAGQWVFVLDSHRIERAVVNTHSQTLILFLHK